MEQAVLSVSQLNEYLRMMMDGDRVLSGHVFNCYPFDGQ